MIVCKHYQNQLVNAIYDADSDLSHFEQVKEYLSIADKDNAIEEDDGTIYASDYIVLKDYIDNY